MELFRLTVSYLKIGVPMPGNILDEAGNLLLSKGHVIDNQASLDKLLARGMFVDLTTFEAHFKTQLAAAGNVAAAENKYDPFAVHESLKTRLNRLLRGVLEKTVTPEDVVELAGQVRAFAERDVEAAVASALLDRREDVYPVGHSLGAATLCAVIGARTGWPESRQLAAVCAAMTMNIGMTEYHQRLHRQAAPLNAAQIELLHRHPQVAVELLQDIGVRDAEWLDAITQHHEKPDGSGYPKQVSDPCETSQLVRIADVFDARSMARGDRKALAPTQIVRALFVDEGKGPCGGFVNTLVKLLGIYPPGSFVRLINNEQAVVFRLGESASTPVVAAVTNSAGSPIMQPVRRETHRKDFAIAGTFVPEKISFGYDLAKLWVTRG